MASQSLLVRAENPYNKRHRKEVIMSTNTEFVRQLADFLNLTKFSPGLSDADIRLQTSLAVIAITSRATVSLKDPYTIADLASQGTHGGGGPHKALAEALKALGALAP
jgi:hypothetical protein